MSAATIASNAAQDAKRGAALVRRFANAVATFAAGVTAEGIFQRAADRATLGGLAMASREITFECITSELPSYVTDGFGFTLALGDAPTVALGPYRVQRAGRTDDLEDRTTELVLELA